MNQVRGFSDFFPQIFNCKAKAGMYFFFYVLSFTGSPQNQSPTEWSKTPAPAHREKAHSTNTQEKRIVSASNVHISLTFA